MYHYFWHVGKQLGAAESSLSPGDENFPFGPLDRSLSRQKALPSKTAWCQEHNNEKVFAFPELSVGMWGWCEGERNSRTSWVKCLRDEVGGHNQGICLCKGLGICKRVFLEEVKCYCELIFVLQLGVKVNMPMDKDWKGKSVCLLRW